jgi:hypothetical protein
MEQNENHVTNVDEICVFHGGKKFHLWSARFLQHVISLVCGFQSSGGKYCLHLQGSRGSDCYPDKGGDRVL